MLGVVVKMFGVGTHEATTFVEQRKPLAAAISPLQRGSHSFAESHTNSIMDFTTTITTNCNFFPNF